MLLNLRFALSPSLVSVFPRPKKVDFVDLLSFSFESEQILTVVSLRELVLRLVKSLGSIAGDKGFYSSVFSKWIDVLCPSSFPLTMSSWAPEYVFRWLSQKLFNVASLFGATASISYSKEEIRSNLGVIVDFQFGTELAFYLASIEYRAFSSRLSAVISGSVAPVVGSLGSPSLKVPVSSQWCMQHARFSLGLNLQPCLGGPTCARLHPVLTRPFTDLQKSSLRSLSNIIQSPAQKNLFLAAII
jgi:hypothetical protein